MAAKKHVPEDPADWKFKRNRNGDEHANNCKDGYCEPKGKDPNRLEIHHILCVHACSDDTFPDDITDEQVTFIEACFKITSWNINGKANNIGLPRKWAYVNDTDDKDHPRGKCGWNNLPCHQVDHDLYLTAVEVYVTDNIWKKLDKAKKAKDCEEVTGQNIAKKFNDGSKKWKDFLKARGKEYGGTKKCLQYCMNGKVHAKLKGSEDQWYVPFSMAPEGTERPRVKPLKGTTLDRVGLFAADNVD